MLHKKLFWVCLLGCLISGLSLQAQDNNLNTTFTRLFQRILGDENGEGGALAIVKVFNAQGQEVANHAEHFKDASLEAVNVLTPALNSLIAGNVSSFPLSSTSAGVTFDFSTGLPVSISESMGPIFAETGKTLGKSKFNIGLNYTFLDLANFRGIKTQDLGFVFTHEDVLNSGLGDTPNESDLLNIELGLDLDASIFVYYTTFGVTKNFDIGIAVPVINISMNGPAHASIDSYTLANGGSANHMFIGGTTNNPLLEQSFDYSESAWGLGDVTLRLKYSFLQGAGVNLAALVDVRVPTGDEENFMGTGKPNVRVIGIMSKKLGDFTPHLNVGYDARMADLDSDEVEFAAGFDQRIGKGLTFAMDILGEFDINTEEAITFPEPVSITDQYRNENRELVASYERTVERTNIPVLDNDNLLNAALGFRFSPAESVILLGNVLIPMNDAGLRAPIVPTAGITISF